MKMSYLIIYLLLGGIFGGLAFAFKSKNENVQKDGCGNATITEINKPNRGGNTEKIYNDISANVKSVIELRNIFVGFEMQDAVVGLNFKPIRKIQTIEEENRMFTKMMVADLSEEYSEIISDSVFYKYSFDSIALRLLALKARCDTLVKWVNESYGVVLREQSKKFDDQIQIAKYMAGSKKVLEEEYNWDSCQYYAYKLKEIKRHPMSMVCVQMISTYFDRLKLYCRANNACVKAINSTKKAYKNGTDLKSCASVLEVNIEGNLDAGQTLVNFPYLFKKIESLKNYLTEEVDYAFDSIRIEMAPCK